MKNETKECVVCGRTEFQNKLTADDRRNNLTEEDIQIEYCRKCGECVCGFCADLQVCH